MTSGYWSMQALEHYWYSVLSAREAVAAAAAAEATQAV